MSCSPVAMSAFNTWPVDWRSLSQMASRSCGTVTVSPKSDCATATRATFAVFAETLMVSQSVDGLLLPSPAYHNPVTMIQPEQETLTTRS